MEMRKFGLLVQKCGHCIVNALHGLLGDGAVFVARCLHKVGAHDGPDFHGVDEGAARSYAFKGDFADAVEEKRRWGFLLSFEFFLPPFFLLARGVLVAGEELQSSERSGHNLVVNTTYLSV